MEYFTGIQKEKKKNFDYYYMKINMDTSKKNEIAKREIIWEYTNLKNF